MILPSSAGLTGSPPPAVFGTRLLLYQILLKCQVFLQNSISFSVSAEAASPLLPSNGMITSLVRAQPDERSSSPRKLQASRTGEYARRGAELYARWKIELPRLHHQIIFAVFIFTPGPMVVAATQLLIYWPLAEAGLALTIAPIRAL